MSKSILSLMALAAIGLAACAETNTLPPGHYENSASSTSRSGTKTTVDKDTDVYYDQYGNKRTTVQTKTTKDPKGLFNKETTKTVKTYN